MCVHACARDDCSQLCMIIRMGNWSATPAIAARFVNAHARAPRRCTAAVRAIRSRGISTMVNQCYLFQHIPTMAHAQRPFITCACRSSRAGGSGARTREASTAALHVCVVLRAQRLYIWCQRGADASRGLGAGSATTETLGISNVGCSCRCRRHWEFRYEM